MTALETDAGRTARLDERKATRASLPTGVATSAASTASSTTSMQAALDAQRRAFDSERAPSLAIRLDRLARLRAMTDRFGAAMTDAISADFGHRPAQVTLLADLMPVRNAIDHARPRLRSWMRTRRVATPWSLKPATSRIASQPIGVVGIVAPWNYPYQLAMGPAVSALAAGDRVMVKPSERTPRFADELARAVASTFAPDEMTVVLGDADVAREFVSLSFDHLLFTGSTAVGREVAAAAARNLVPATLELGGKSPAILDADCDLDEALPRLMAAKLFNAGQTCIAPDYVLAHERHLDGLPDAMRRATSRLYPTIAGNRDYTTLIDDRHLARVQGLVDDARAKGATVVPLHDETDTHDRRMPPVAVVDVDDHLAVAHEEIFGPVMPIVVYRRRDDAIDYVNARERPLALYWFGRDAAARHAVLSRTVSGGVTIDDCLFHCVQDALPFGGVGASGQGRYHGEHGFRTFSHDKGVFVQSRWAVTGMMAPPYGRTFERIARWLK